jgi:hypothetical protein
LDTAPPEIQQRGRAADSGEAGAPLAMDAALAKIVLGDDLDDAQFAWCVERLVPEAPGLTQARVDQSPFRARPAMHAHSLEAVKEAFAHVWVRRHLRSAPLGFFCCRMVQSRLSQASMALASPGPPA